MSHENFRLLLSHAIVVHNGQKLTAQQREKPVRIQWDPERDPYLNELAYRSIQIGIGPEISRKWAEDWVESIEDVTNMANRLKEVVDKRGEGGEMMGWDELVEHGLCPNEREYEVDEELRKILEITST